MSDENCNKERDKKSKLEADDALSFSTPIDTVNSPTDITPLEASASDTATDTANKSEDNKTAVNTDNVSTQKQTQTQANNPLQGIKLQTIVEELEAQYGWDGLAYRINIKCFKSDPSVKSSLKFLRRTPWARDKVERLYLKTFHKKYRPESY
jgi:hypothetical protein